MNNCASRVNQPSSQSATKRNYNPAIVNGGRMSNKEIRRILAKNVINLMESLNMSAMDIERQSGGDIVNRTVGYVLKEERSIGIDMVEALGKAFKVQPSMLLTELSDNDLEHLKLLATLTFDEKQEVSTYASFLIGKRDSPDS